MINKLMKCKSREEAVIMLIGLNKSQLQLLAKELMVRSKPSKKDLMDKIIENTVGLALRSEAIQTTELKRCINR